MSMIDKSMEPPDFDDDNEVEEPDDYDGEEYTGPGEREVEKPSKEEYQVAKWMKKNVRTKKTKFLSHVVEYFSSNKAIDALLKSKFAEGDNALFTTREHVVEYLDMMLEHKFFHRAKKVPVSIEEIRGAGGGTNSATKDQSATSTPKPTKSKKEKQTNDGTKDKEGDKEKTTSEAENVTEAAAAGGAGDESNNKDKKEKRKRKIRLDMHPEQVFVDGSEAYVWIYDPIPIHYWIYGLILLLGAIGICLFPLWPPILRKGVYYLSIAAAGFLVFILALTVVRLIIFTIVWALTAGKLHFWIFPNLTEDVGFFASFWPLYESNYVTEKSSKSEKRSKSKSKKQKEKDSDAEDDNGTEEATSSSTSPLITSKIEEIKEHDVAVDEEHKAACSTKDDESSHSSGGYNTDEPNENENESSDNKYSDDSDLSGYCILDAGDTPNEEASESKPIKAKKDN